MDNNAPKRSVLNGLVSRFSSLFMENISKKTRKSIKSKKTRKSRKSKKTRITQRTKDLKNYLDILAKSNIKYRWWYKGDDVNENGPFYYENKKVPSIEKMQEKGINCAGLINICYRYLKIKLPSEGGGTEGWFNHFSNKNIDGKMVLIPINIECVYPIGTILLRDYHSEKDQGHLSMVYNSSKKLKNTKIIHAYSSSPINRNLNDPGIIIEDFSQSHSWFNGTYTHVVLPSQWIV